MVGGNFGEEPSIHSKQHTETPRRLGAQNPFDRNELSPRRVLMIDQLCMILR